MKHSSAPSSTVRPTFARLRALCRVVGVVTCVAALGGAWLLRKVHAQMGERALDLGEGLARAHSIQAGSTRVRLNGATLTLNSSSTALSVDAVLDRFTELCANSNRELGDRLDAQASLPKQRELSWTRLSVFRTPTRHDQATAACLARNRKADTLAAFLASASDAIDSGDLAKIGQFRYVFARKSAHTGATQVISVWNEGALKVEDMFPEHGDAPGLDLVEGVRPEHSTRLIAAEAEGSRFQLALYESEDTPSRALASYHARLAQHGYVALEPGTMDEAMPLPTRVYSLGQRDRIVVLAQEDSGKTLVSTYRLDSSGSVALEP